jgi:hypothetical protein
VIFGKPNGNAAPVVSFANVRRQAAATPTAWVKVCGELMREQLQTTLRRQRGGGDSVQEWDNYRNGCISRQKDL